jgi:uncharacterized protein YndB with AHSA1/START domain
MERLNFSIMISAPREKVWHTMLDDQSYREWTKAFMPGSYYKGEWREGAKMLFLGPDPDTGEEGGMVSRVKTVTPYECVSVEHLGIIANGEEDTTSDEARKWTPSQETYSLRETPEGTEVLVETDTADEYKTMFEEMWPKALASLKRLAEGRVEDQRAA